MYIYFPKLILLRENNISWEAASKLNPVSENAPQPTFTYGFPVHIHDTEGTPPTGFSRNECVANFSLGSLTDLAPIIACPTVDPSTLKTRMAEGQKPGTSDLICFPWALVEVQSGTELAELCYCQAATGAHTALSMLRHLYQTKDIKPDIIPPVISFTCYGPEIRVWLSFSKFQIPKPLTVSVAIQINEQSLLY
jgi:hypothetical protein